jgi:hypothetical protein
MTNHAAICIVAQTHAVANASLSAIRILYHVTLACGLKSRAQARGTKGPESRRSRETGDAIPCCLGPSPGSRLRPCASVFALLRRDQPSLEATARHGKTARQVGPARQRFFSPHGLALADRFRITPSLEN